MNAEAFSTLLWITAIYFAGMSAVFLIILFIYIKRAATRQVVKLLSVVLFFLFLSTCGFIWREAYLETYDRMALKFARECETPLSPEEVDIRKTKIAPSQFYLVKNTTGEPMCYDAGNYSFSNKKSVVFSNDSCFLKSIYFSNFLTSGDTVKAFATR